MRISRAFRHPARAAAGVTLMELLVSLTTGGLIIGAAMWLYVLAAQTFASLGNYDSLNYKGRNALDTMTTDIRACLALSTVISNGTCQQLVFTNTAGALYSTVTYSYTNGTGMLTRAAGGQSSILLSNITSLTFNLSQRNPTNNFSFVATTNAALTKLVSVTWACSLPVYGTMINDSESIQTANIVIRN